MTTTTKAIITTMHRATGKSRLEMLAISSEIDAWRKKKESEHANARYNEYMQSKGDE